MVPAGNKAKCLSSFNHTTRTIHHHHHHLKAIEPLRGGSLLFTIKFPGGPGTQLIGLGRMKGQVDLGVTHWF